MVRHSNSGKDNKDIKKESDLKKFFKKRSFIYLVCAVVFVVFFVPDMIQPSDLEQVLVKNIEDDNQKSAWEIIKQYKGTDDEGSDLFDIIITQIENAYPSEKILKHNDTVLEVFVVDVQQQNSIGFYEVHFTFQTYNDAREYIWKVNIETKEIIPVNDGARKMINIVNNYD